MYFSLAGLFIGIEVSRRFMLIKNVRARKAVLPFMIGLIIFSVCIYSALKHIPIEQNILAYSIKPCNEFQGYVDQYNSGKLDLYKEVADYIKEKAENCK